MRVPLPSDHRVVRRRGHEVEVPGGVGPVCLWRSAQLLRPVGAGQACLRPEGERTPVRPPLQRPVRVLVDRGLCGRRHAPAEASLAGQGSQVPSSKLAPGDVVAQPTPPSQRRQPDFHIQVGGRHHSRHWLLVAGAAATPSYNYLQTLSHKIIIFWKKKCTSIFFVHTAFFSFNY